MSRPKTYDRVVILSEINRLSDGDKPPTVRQAGDSIVKAAKREFGSWREACEAAGKTPRNPGRPKKS